MKLNFESIHEAGAKEFPSIWMTANEKAIEAAMALGVDHTTPPHKLLISRIVLCTLRVARQQAILASKLP